MAEVVLFHHAQGLTDGVRAFAETLREAGHTVHLPDVYEGNVFGTLDEGLDYARQTGFGVVKDRAVAAGEKLGVSGIGNGVPHLHLGLLLDNEVEQDSWTFILREGEIRKVMGNYKNGELLPMPKQ